MSGASIINLLFDLIEYDRTTDTIEDFKFTVQQGWDYLDLGTHGLTDSSHDDDDTTNIDNGNVLLPKETKQKKNVLEIGYRITPCESFTTINFAATLIDYYI